jgi:hypothetical protein
MHLHGDTTLPTVTRTAKVPHNGAALCGFERNY